MNRKCLLLMEETGCNFAFHTLRPLNPAAGPRVLTPSPLLRYETGQNLLRPPRPKELMGGGSKGDETASVSP